MSETEENKKFTAAFVVAIDETGRVFLELDKEAVSLDVEREATMIEVRRYLSEILMDLQAQGSAEYVLNAITMVQQQAAAAAAPQE